MKPRWRIATAGVGLAALVGACGPAPRLALDPLPVQDDDRYDIPEPRTRTRDDYYDLVDRTFFKSFEQAADMPRNLRKLAGKPKQAENVTPLDEVLDSSWFTNRAFTRRITPDEMRQGPNHPVGPDLEHTWTLVAGKTQGVTPGFTIQDANGHRFVIKFDPLSDPELATGAEAISTRLFWALGYNVPENYLVFFRPEILEISPKATVKLPLGKKRPMTRQDLDVILAKVPRQADGSIRAIASRFIAGVPKGPIPFLGRRKDDPNDVVRHEHRRELRGYRVSSAWTNHNDCREINSLDMYVEEDGRHFMKHYLIDFGATLGSASTGVNLRSEGHEYLMDLGEMGLSLVTLGLHQRRWTSIEYDTIPGVGLFEADHFDPRTWKPNYPLPIFENTTARDGFWAAKRVMSLDDELLRAAVESAAFSDPRATAHIFAILRQRRDRTGRYWFSRLNPLDRFEIVAAPTKPGQPTAGPASLRFEDLAVTHGFVPRRRYDVVVFGPGGRMRSLETEVPEIPLGDFLRQLGDPAPQATSERLLRLSLRSSLPNQVTWTPRVDVTVYLPPQGAPRVVAIERDE